MKDNTKNIEISNRLKLIASMVTKGNRLADVGTDHGYVPIYLIKAGMINEALAMDINKGPLLRANEHIKEYALEDKVTTRLSDGLEAYNKGEADTILIAGMGGALTVHILTEGLSKLDDNIELVLSPQSEIFLVRDFLQKNHFVISEEKLIFDEGKYYTVIKAVRGEDDTKYSGIEMEYGYVALRNKDEVLKALLERDIAKYTAIMEKIKDESSESSKDRLKDIAKKVENIKDALSYY